jgi:hypothetical protein
VHVQALKSTPQEGVMNPYSSSPPARRRPQAWQWPDPAQGTLITPGFPSPTTVVSPAWAPNSPVPHRRHTRAPATIRATS